MKDELTTAEVIDYSVGKDKMKLGVIKMPSFYFDPEDRNVRGVPRFGNTFGSPEEREY